MGGLFGFDSSATIAFGARVGLTNRLSVSVYRSNLFQTISLSTAFQVSRQSAETPLTLQLRGGVDGKHNFGLYDRDINPTPNEFSPDLQIVATRTFKDRVLSQQSLRSCSIPEMNSGVTISPTLRSDQITTTRFHWVWAPVYGFCPPLPLSENLYRASGDSGGETAIVPGLNRSAGSFDRSPEGHAASHV